MNKIKFPKRYKYGFRIIGEPSTKGLILDRFWYPLWLKKPICFIKGHKNKIFWPLGMKIKQCIRCGKFHFKKKTTERQIKFSGEIGKLYGVRFLETNKKNDTILD